jgi:hypothetical protein
MKPFSTHLARAYIPLLSLSIFCSAGCLSPGPLQSPPRIVEKWPPIPAPSPDKQEIILPVDRVSQKLDHWCWAATAEMIGKFYKFPWTQCDQAGVLWANDHICVNGAPRSDFDAVGWPYFTPHFGFQPPKDREEATFSSIPLSGDALYAQLATNHPLAYAYFHEGLASGHMVVIYGVNPVTGELYIRDPSRQGQEQAVITWDNYISQFHWRTYSDIIPVRSTP